MAIAEHEVVLVASTAVSIDGATLSADLGVRDRLLRLVLAVTAASGATPVLSVRLESSPDGLFGWKPFGTFEPLHTASSPRQTFISPERFVRVAWSIAGDSPSFTFALSGMLDTVYANLGDLEKFGLPCDALRLKSPHDRAEALAASSEVANGKIALAYDLPLAAWGLDLTQAIAKMAAYDLLSTRGFNPEGSDQNIRDRYRDAMKWLDDVATAKVKLLGLVDATPAIIDDGVAISTYALRGWGCR